MDSLYLNSTQFLELGAVKHRANIIYVETLTQNRIVDQRMRVSEDQVLLRRLFEPNKGSGSIKAKINTPRSLSSVLRQILLGSLNQE